MDFQIGVHNNPDEDRLSFDASKTNVTLDYLGLNNVSVVDKESSRQNLDAIDQAISKVVGNRAELGALQNRLVSTTNNLGVLDENLSAARSRIQDADMAQETAELAKANVLTAANVAVLSQANQSNMIALRLLNL